MRKLSFLLLFIFMVVMIIPSVYSQIDDNYNQIQSEKLNLGGLKILPMMRYNATATKAHDIFTFGTPIYNSKVDTSATYFYDVAPKDTVLYLVIWGWRKNITTGFKTTVDSSADSANIGYKVQFGSNGVFSSADTLALDSLKSHPVIGSIKYDSSIVTSRSLYFCSIRKYGIGANCFRVIASSHSAGNCATATSDAKRGYYFIGVQRKPPIFTGGN